MSTDMHSGTPGTCRPDSAAASYSPQGGGRKRFITSCVTCRRRKVRCDRQKPTCARCNISGYQCSYNQTEIPEGVSTVPPRRLQHALENTNEGDVDEEDEIRGKRQKRSSDDVLERLQRLEEIVRQHVKDQCEDDSGGAQGKRASSHTALTNPEQGTEVSGSGVTEVHSGKLLVQSGRTRYVSPLFWGVITDEIHDLSSLILEEPPSLAPSPAHSTPSHSSPDYFSNGPPTTHDDDHFYSLAFPRATCTSYTTNQFLPHRRQAEFLLSVFRYRVDPLLRLLHIPTFITAFRIYYDNFERGNGMSWQEVGPSVGVYQGSSNASFEALLFAVFYAAVNSLTEEEVVGHVNSTMREEGGGCDAGQMGPVVGVKQRMLAEYKRATEVALLKARFLEQGDLVTVMAFAILLICLCHEADVPSLYPLTGLLLRIAQSLGLHRDPALLFSSAPRKPPTIPTTPTPSFHLNIPATTGITLLEAELRRRLWHHICHLDLRVCEAHGPDPGILLEEKMWPLGPATRFPACVNDEEIDLDSDNINTTINTNTLPVQDPGRFTRMSMQLLRFNASLCVRRIMNPAAAPGVRCRTGGKMGGKREVDVEELVRREVEMDLEGMVSRCEKFYLRYCDDDDDDHVQGGSGAGEKDTDLPALKKLTKAAGLMIEAKLRMLYYHRFIKGKKLLNPTESWNLRKNIIIQSLSLIRNRTTLLTDPTLTAYHWHIKVHTNFHATFHVLSEMCEWEVWEGGKRDEMSRLRGEAWEVLDGMDWSREGGMAGGMGSGNGSLREWEVLRRLRERAERMEMGDVGMEFGNGIAGAVIDTGGGGGRGVLGGGAGGGMDMHAKGRHGRGETSVIAVGRGFPAGYQPNSHENSGAATTTPTTSPTGGFSSHTNPQLNTTTNPTTTSSSTSHNLPNLATQALNHTQPPPPHPHHDQEPILPLNTPTHTQTQTYITPSAQHTHNPNSTTASPTAYNHLTPQNHNHNHNHNHNRPPTPPWMPMSLHPGHDDSGEDDVTSLMFPFGGQASNWSWFPY